MKTFTAISTILSLLATASLAAPIDPQAVPTAAIAFSNDMTGAYARIEIPFGKTVHLIPELLQGTAIDVFRDQSSFLATSISLVGGFASNPICALQSNDAGKQAERIERQLTANKSYAKLGGQSPEELGRLEVVEIRGAFLQCDSFPNA